MRKLCFSELKQGADHASYILEHARHMKTETWKFLQHTFPLGASTVTQWLKNPPSLQETRVQFLGWEDPLEKGMATHSSIPAWRIPWMEEPGRVGYSP